jgi:hypothetical protein
LLQLRAWEFLAQWQDLATILSHQIREWEFQDRWQDLEIIRSHPHRECLVQDLQVKDQIALVADLRLVPRGDQGLRSEQVAEHREDSFRVVSQVHSHHVQALAAEVEEAPALPELLVAAVLRTSQESRSVKSAKSLN